MNVRRFAIPAAIAALLLIALPIRLAAWGAVGHHVVARIAWALMTPAAQQRAGTLLEGGFEQFVAAATWADDVRTIRPETYNWHFVDIPVDAARYDEKRDCPATDKGDCVIAEIARARQELVDPARSNQLKGEALKFLIHFVGDLHQPLHTTDNHDRGGNDVKVKALRGEAGRDTNLHAAWDTGLINLSEETEAARATRLLADLKARPPQIDLDVMKWIQEGHDVAIKVTYNFPSFKVGAPSPDPIDLDEAYRAAAIKTIDQRLAIGGARLAALLNSLLDK